MNLMWNGLTKPVDKCAYPALDWIGLGEHMAIQDAQARGMKCCLDHGNLQQEA